MNQYMITSRQKKRGFLKEAPIHQHTWSAERRRFVRFPCGWKVKFEDLDSEQPSLHDGKCRNLSQGGMKLTSFQPLKRKSIVLLEINSDLFSIHIKLDQILKAANNRILAEVAWRHLNLQTGLFEAGLQFVEENQRKFFQPQLEQAASI